MVPPACFEHATAGLGNFIPIQSNFDSDRGNCLILLYLICIGSSRLISS